MNERIAICCLTGFLAALSFVGAVPVSFGAELARVTVPSQRQWCVERSMAAVDLGNLQRQQEQLGAIIQELANAAASVDWFSLGMPALQRYDLVDETTVRVTFCANVGTATPPPDNAGITVNLGQEVEVLAIVCENIEFDACGEAIVEELKGNRWNVSEETIETLSVYSGETAGSGSFAEQVVAAINDTEALIYDKTGGRVISASTAGPRMTVLAYGLP